MTEELLDNMSLLIFKNQLLCGEMKDLKEFYKDERCFLNFLDTIALVSQREPAFFLISSEIKDRILQIIEIHRFSANDEVLAYINEILVYLNSLDSLPEKFANMIVQSYLEFHEELRNTKFADISQFLHALSYDAVFVTALDDGKLDLLNGYELNKSSFNYLIYTSPAFFQKREVMDRAIKVLNNEERKTKIFSKKKKDIKNIRKALNDITRKEE